MKTTVITREKEIGTSDCSSSGNSPGLLVKYLAFPLLKLYRLVFSPMMYILGSRCRFYPSCSHYAEDAFRYHGFFYGLFLTSKRVIKCNPLHPGGFDPVPGVETEKRN